MASPAVKRTTTVGSFEAKTHLAALIDRAAAGEEVIITRRGKPVARLVAMEPSVDIGAREAVERLRAMPRPTLGGIGWKALRDDGRKW
jgi:prevent-host-death family protein